MPLVIWAYPRGRDIEKKGGRDSFFAIDYAARVAMEMGADVVKLNMPKLNPEKDKDAPAPYNEMEVTLEEAIRHCVESAGRSLVVLSGGSKVDDDKLLEQTRMIMEAGGSGVIFGRNVWQREWGAGARDHRADQGDAAQVAHADPVDCSRSRGRLQRLAPREARLGLVPPRDALLVELPAQVDLVAVADRGEVDQPAARVAQHDVERLELRRRRPAAPAPPRPRAGPG